MYSERLDGHLCEYIYEHHPEHLYEHLYEDLRFRSSAAAQSSDMCRKDVL